MKFKVGDIVTGISKKQSGSGLHRYSMTTDEAEMKVIDIGIKVHSGEINVKILRHKTKKIAIGKTFIVESEYFKLVNRKQMNKSVYWECKTNSHSKFWAAHIIEKRIGIEDIKYTLVRKWGRIGNNPQTVEQVFDNKFEADGALSNLVWEKEQKGYKPIF